MCEIHKRVPWVTCMVIWDCAACHVMRTHVVAYGTMESGVMLMGEKPGRKTSILEHGLVKFLILFF